MGAVSVETEVEGTEEDVIPITGVLREEVDSCFGALMLFFGAG